jgi:hypothetical protein
VPGRAASLLAGRKENRWPAGGRGSRVRPHSGLDPGLSLPFQGQSPPASATSSRHTGHIGVRGDSAHFSESRGIREGGEFGNGRGVAEGIRLPTMAMFLDLKHSATARSGETPMAIMSYHPVAGGGRELEQGQKLARRPTLLSLHLATLCKTPALSFAEQKGHPFIHMQKAKFSLQPPALRAVPHGLGESPALGAGARLQPQDWRAAQPFAGRADRPGIALLKSLPQAVAAAAAGGGEFI